MADLLIPGHEIFVFVQEGGVHENANYSFVVCRGWGIKHLIDDVGRYERMRSTFNKDQRHERYFIEGYRHLKVEKKIDEDDNITSDEAIKPKDTSQWNALSEFRIWTFEGKCKGCNINWSTLNMFVNFSIISLILWNFFFRLFLTKI